MLTRCLMGLRRFWCVKRSTPIVALALGCVVLLNGCSDTLTAPGGGEAGQKVGIHVADATSTVASDELSAYPIKDGVAFGAPISPEVGINANPEAQASAQNSCDAWNDELAWSHGYVPKWWVNLTFAFAGLFIGLVLASFFR